MLFDSTRQLLQSIVIDLEETRDDSRWDDQAESGSACLYEMHQMSGHLYKAYKTETSYAGEGGQASLPERLNRALPYVRSMSAAIRHKDRAMALESGKAGLAELNGASPCQPSDPRLELNSEGGNALNLAPRRGSPPGPRRHAAEDRGFSRRGRR